jgi:hypothetical protein
MSEKFLQQIKEGLLARAPVPDHPCLVCGKGDGDKPMVFRGEQWCSDNHRKVVIGEKEPTTEELETMSQELFDKLRCTCLFEGVLGECPVHSVEKAQPAGYLPKGYLDALAKEPKGFA